MSSYIQSDDGNVLFELFFKMLIYPVFFLDLDHDIFQYNSILRNEHYQRSWTPQYIFCLFIDYQPHGIIEVITSGGFYHDNLSSND